MRAPQEPIDQEPEPVAGSSRDCRLRGGVLHLAGKPRALVAGEYPYFRDDVRHWRGRLEAQRDAGLEVVTTYVPWRHHAPLDPVRTANGYDFGGRTQPNRNLQGFLDECAALGLQVILKPGPFVHAELPYGGLPDYVDPHVNPAIEAELDAEGAPVRWGIRGMRGASRRALPAPLGYAYTAYVRHWLQAVAQEVVIPRMWPEGPVLALQLMNEGIYSDSSNADPRQLGFAVSTLVRFHHYLAEHYGSLEEYNAAHGTRFGAWDEIDPPRRVHALRRTADVLAFLDWSAFQGRLYRETAERYRDMLVGAGMSGEAPIFFNFNPNGETYRDQPASNDGWYTRVIGATSSGFTFGSTNWLGVVASDPAAFRQYVMATTLHRGPAMEQNWGFSSQYFQPYEYESPSHFESMLGIAVGATGINAYTFIGTRAWRDDPNLTGEWMPERTNNRNDETRGDYPGDAPVLSNGERTPKFWTLKQMAQYLRHEGPRFVAEGPRAAVAWGIYAPYAWAGQWLPRGDADDLLWRPPLASIPRGAYHGLDAFVEVMHADGRGFRQVDVANDELGPDVPVLMLTGHEYMDAGTQVRLARYVERGGRLLVTDLVPDKDNRMRPLRGALAERVFPHVIHEMRHLQRPLPVEVDGEQVGLAFDNVCVLEPPRDADMRVTIDGHVIGYRRRIGEGVAIFMGAGPWRARHSRDDPFLAQQSQRLMRALIERLDPPDRLARPEEGAEGEVVVWHHGEGTRQQLFVVVREHEGPVRVRLRRPDGQWSRLTLTSPSQAVHAIALQDGRLRACYLKGVNDMRGQRVTPQVELDGDVWQAEDACDLCVSRAPDGGLEVSVAHLDGRDATRVRLDGATPGALRVPDLARAPAVRVRPEWARAADAARR